MVHTLPEYAKTVEDDKARAVIEMFPEMSDVMGAIPFMTAPGGSYRYQREGALPNNMAFRGINETPTDGHGVLNDLVEQTFPVAGNLDVDRVLVNRHGTDRRAREEAMMIKAKAKLWSDTFINGDNATQPREYTGLKTRLRAVNNSVDGTNYESRILANSVAAGGGPLSLAQLDLAISLVEDPTHLIMPKALKTRLPAAARDQGTTGFVTQDKDEMGKTITRYGELPILTGYEITPLGEFLPFNEVGFGGGAAVTSSIYVVSFREGGLCGLEVAPMEVTDFGLTEGAVYYRTNVEHDNGICLEGAYAALRMSSITNAPIQK
ncbi:hypothetical protein JANAI62_03740 [Jannaschia pagri]|uniref:Phage major capsid protein, HK97 family n=1 Tax=Jannaschia pagri TaxID=2829797 RepID=A0ABQ4NHJ2_9RHOB|nr:MULTISPECIES: hypothetical protein [unclassified Jannaschia]GIT90143.1 hypothetical protein JANAI61_06010 [Jannaschia sp. AI_61]GIT93751.1 hypothetical protein JANAI62_03740 [Jannaschia sp. AI_62]